MIVRITYGLAEAKSSGSETRWADFKIITVSTAVPINDIKNDMLLHREIAVFASSSLP